MLEGSDQETLSCQQGSEMSRHGVAKMMSHENNHPDFERRTFHESICSIILSGWEAQWSIFRANYA